DDLTQLCFENVKADDSGTKISNVIRERISRVLNEIKVLKSINIDNDAVIRGIERDLTGIKTICNLLIEIEKQDKQFESPFANLILKDPKVPNEKEILFTYIILKHSLSFYQTNNSPEILYEELLLQKILIDFFKDAGRNVDRIFEEAALIQALLSKHNLTKNKDLFVRGKENIFISELINNREVSAYLLLNEFGNIIYFNKERFENIVNWIFILSFITTDMMQQKEGAGNSTTEQKPLRNKGNGKDTAFRNEFRMALETLRLIKDKSNESGYRLITFKELLSTKGVEDNAPVMKKITKKISSKKKSR
ncbi:MAG: hypothetical protein ACYDA4_17085, partial [Ignavibacteriaceae bacterium]